MPIHVTKYSVFIASPGDVADERDAATEAIHRWNALHSNVKGVVLEPLRWESGSSPNADRPPQEVINQQLLARADLLIGVFWARLGTPTEGFPGGAVEEVAKFRGTKMVYFKDKPPLLDLSNPERQAREVQKVAAFREECQSNGYCASYQGLNQFRNKLLDHITLWANDEALRLSTTTVRPFELGKTSEGLVRDWESSGQEGIVLLYNPELTSFRDAQTFEAVWGWLSRQPHVERAYLLLPEFKLRRLVQFVSRYRDRFEAIDGDGFFRVCEFARDEAADPLSSGVSFTMFRMSEDPEAGEVHPRIHLFVLSPPLAEPLPPEPGSSDALWDYRYTVDLVALPELSRSLQALWSSHYRSERCDGVSELLDGKSPAASSTLDEIESIVDDDKAPSFDEVFDLSLRIRAFLFDPNVPTYILNSNFFLLDWNPTFELIFPTETFQRGQNLNHFLKCLSNYDATLVQGKASFMDPNNYPLFHEETFEFESPRYGRMEFTKVTSPVRGGNSGEIIGWNVALNVDLVQRRDLFEEERRRANEIDALHSRYAHAYDRITQSYSEYRELASRHAQALADSQNLLDLGAGPGSVTRMLLEAEKRVTAIDANDAMLRILRRRCSRHRGRPDRLRVVKMNIENLRPETFRKGPKLEKFGGATLLNVVYQLEEPKRFFGHLQEVLVPGAIVAISGPRQDADLHSLFQDIQMDHSRRAGRDPQWIKDFLVFRQVNFRMAQDGMLYRTGPEEIRSLLDGAGFSILEDQCEDQLYGGQGAFIVARRD